MNRHLFLFALLFLTLLAVPALAGNQIVCYGAPGSNGCYVTFTSTTSGCNITIPVPGSTGSDCQAWNPIRADLNSHDCCEDSPPNQNPWVCAGIDGGVCILPANNCEPASYLGAWYISSETCDCYTAEHDCTP